MIPGISSLGVVLVVDDDRIFRTVTETLLQSRGASVVQTAVNGAQALEMVDSGRDQIGLILCDLEMPELDGVQFLRLLKKRAYRGPIIIISGTEAPLISMAADLAELHDLNIIGALPKPLNCSELDRILSTLKPDDVEQAPTPKVPVSVDELRTALSREEILVHYQPKIDLSTGRISGIEAMARWNHPILGAIAPQLFIPATEQAGLIKELTERVLHTAISDAKRWQKLRLMQVKCSVAVNLSVEVLDDLNLADEIAALVDESGLERSLFTWEINQGRLLEQAATPKELVARLRMMGFELSIDDFGTADSNTHHLGEFAFSELKIDCQQLSRSESDHTKKTAILNGLALAKSLGMRVVAKSIETEADWQLALRFNADHGQGFLIAEPMPLDQLLRWVFDHSESCRTGAIARASAVA